MIREDQIGRQTAFFGLMDDPWPGLGDEDIGTRLFVTDRKAIMVWDGDRWVPGSSGWFTLYQANLFVSRTSANDATDDDFQVLHTFNMPPDLMSLASAIRVWHWWLVTSSANTKAVGCYLNGSAIAAPTTTTNIQLGQSNLLYMNGAQNNVYGMNNSTDIGATGNNPLNPANADFAKATAITWQARWTTQPIAGGETITLQRVAVELFN